jgi:hypothetical protein
MAEPTQTFGPWLRQKLVEAGEIAPDAQGVNLDPKVRDAYLRMWQNESKGGAEFTPSTGMATNEVSKVVTPYFMSSPNSAQPMIEKQPVLKPVSGKDGKAYNYNPVTGTYAPALIEGTTNQFEMDPKANRMQELMDALGGAPAEEEESQGILASIFGGAKATPPPTPSPTPMATPAPTTARTNAPVPAATPAALTTPEAVRAAFLAGQISEAQAVQMLRGGR